jgi:hypothetical protein
MTVEEKLTTFLRSLPIEELDQLTENDVVRARKAARRHSAELSAYRVELQEAHRIIEETAQAIEKAEAEGARARKSGEVEWIGRAQAQLKRLKKRLRSYSEAVPGIRATIERLGRL